LELFQAKLHAFEPRVALFSFASLDIVGERGFAI
jgi:hypothetical protein